MADKSAQIRIVKKKKVHGGHHGGAWKVAYADFVTAMMAFFLVMWIVGLSQDVKENVAGYFEDPNAFAEAVAAGTNPGGPNTPGSADGQVQERERLKETKETIEKIVAATPEFSDLSKHIDIKLVDEGLMVDLLEAKESLFFDSASAKVKPNAERLLAKIAGELQKLPNKVIIEGHTDIRPLARTDGYTNWELSSDRALSARRVMQAAGLKKDQIAQVRGYAATQLREPKDPEHFSNRRVTIIVVQTDAMKKQQFGKGKKKAADDSSKPRQSSKAKPAARAHH